MEHINIRANVMEFIGVFALVYFGGWALYNNEGKLGEFGPALTYGSILGTMFYIGSKISGSHFNPAVTLGLTITGNSNIIMSFCYLISQLLGSIVAGYFLIILTPGESEKNKAKLAFPHLARTSSISQGLLLETIASLFLVFVYYACVVHRKASPETSAVLVGVSLFATISSFGAITGGAFNPIRTFGPSIFANQFLERGWWIFYAGPLIGGALGALIYEFIFASEDSNYERVPNSEIEGLTSEMQK